MLVTSTQRRKDLYQTLDRAIQSEAVEINHKGVTILRQLAAGSKLSRAVRRPSLLVNPDAIVESDGDLMTELEQKWQREAESF